jgi:DNA polymerase I-like protein with 3'-5' exonuclease and polymerase domains
VASRFTKRGALPKEYRRIFIPSDGYEFLEADVSQAELRLVAWMANDPYMIQLYRQGGDIHAATAAMVMGISIEEFYTFPKDVKSLKRTQAKASIRNRGTPITGGRDFVRARAAWRLVKPSI